MVGKKGKEKVIKEADLDSERDTPTYAHVPAQVPISTSVPTPAPTGYQPPPLPGIDYKEKLTYSNMMSELLGLIGFAINRGGSGETELNTAWAYLLPELREELEEYRNQSIEVLRSELASIPDGLIYFNDNTKTWEAIGNDNNKVLNVRELIHSRNQKEIQSIMFNSTMNKRKIRQSGILKHELTQAYVLDIIPQIINTLQSHDLLMQTRKKTEIGAFSMVRKEGNEQNIETEDIIEDNE